MPASSASTDDDAERPEPDHLGYPAGGVRRHHPDDDVACGGQPRELRRRGVRAVYPCHDGGGQRRPMVPTVPLHEPRDRPRRRTPDAVDPAVVQQHAVGPALQQLRLRRHRSEQGGRAAEPRTHVVQVDAVRCVARHRPPRGHVEPEHVAVDCGHGAVAGDCGARRHCARRRHGVQQARAAVGAAGSTRRALHVVRDDVGRRAPRRRGAAHARPQPALGGARGHAALALLRHAGRLARGVRDHGRCDRRRGAVRDGADVRCADPRAALAWPRDGQAGDAGRGRRCADPAGGAVRGRPSGGCVQLRRQEHASVQVADPRECVPGRDVWRRR
eukprot:PhM_4_TR2468/c1_g2_i14/m.11099